MSIYSALHFQDDVNIHYIGRRERKTIVDIDLAIQELEDDTAKRGKLQLTTWNSSGVAFKTTRTIENSRKHFNHPENSIYKIVQNTEKER